MGSVYRPPAGNVEVFCESLVTSLEEIGNNYNKDIFILGDFNINYLDKGSLDTKQLLQLESLTGLKQIISSPTRLQNCIDLIFTNCNEVANRGVLALNVSDHDLIFVTKKKAIDKREHVDFWGRSYRNYDKANFQGQILNCNWDPYWTLQDPNDCWEFILNSIETIINPMCPIKKRRVRNSNEPWINNGILEAIFDKDQAWKHAKRTKRADDMSEARRMRNDVKDMIRRAKKDFIQEELDNNGISNKKFWEKINHILPSKDKGNTIRLMNRDEGVVIEDESLPDYINTFFTDIGPNLASHFRDEWIDNLPEFVGDKMSELQVDYQGIENIIKEIDTHKSSSVPNLSSGVLKDAFGVIILELVYMFNLSFQLGIYPDAWKIANVIPLKKGGDPTDVNNLRPVSLLPLPGKMAERIMHTHMSQYLETNKLLNENQGGFRKGKSTISTIAAFTDDILKGLNEKQYTVACFIDLRKAFDTINHEILLKKIVAFGVTDKIKLWITNYLKNRQQKCTVNGRTSSELLIRCGVPQGSILGPLLFLMYINDIDDGLIHSKVQLYADDTVIYASHEDEGVAHLWVSEDLKVLSNWCNKNQLTVNKEKTKMMLFGTRNMLKKGEKADTYMTGSKLKYVTFFNYLGIRLDNTLNFELHASECLRMVAHKVYLLSRVRKYITIGQAITIYKSKIVPYFDYGDIFLMNVTIKTQTKLQRLQNRALRICLAQDGRSNVNDMHNTCSINKLDHRRSAHLLNFVYKRAQDEKYRQEKGRDLRRYNAPILQEIKANNKYFERSILYQGAKLWNAQTVATRHIGSRKVFKKDQKCKLNALLPY